MKENLIEHLYLCEDVKCLKGFVNLQIKQAERWISKGINVGSNAKWLAEKGLPAKEALKNVHNLEQLFNLLKD